MRKIPDQMSIPEIEDPAEVLKAIHRLDLADQPDDEFPKRLPVDADVSGRSASTGGQFSSRSVKDLGLLLDEEFVRGLMMRERTKHCYPVEVTSDRSAGVSPGASRSSQEPSPSEASPVLPPFLIEPPLANRRRRGAVATAHAGGVGRAPLGLRSRAREREALLHGAGDALRQGAVLEEDPEDTIGPPRPTGEGPRPVREDAVSEFWSGLAGPSMKGWASEETVAIVASRAADPDVWIEEPERGTDEDPSRSEADLQDLAQSLPPSSGRAHRPFTIVGAPAERRRIDDNEAGTRTKTETEIEIETKAASEDEGEWVSWLSESSGHRPKPVDASDRRSRALLYGLASLALPGWGQSLNRERGKARFFRVSAFITLLLADVLIFRHALAGLGGPLSSLGAAQAPLWIVGTFLAGAFSWLLSAYDAFVVTTNRH